MLIDCHQHTNWIQKNSDDVVRDMDRAGIDISWLLSWEVPPGEYDSNCHSIFDPRRTGMPLDDIIYACQRHPSRFVAGYAPDPRRPDAIERLEAAVKMLNVRVCGELKVRMVLDDPDALRFFQKCGELGLPVVLHIDIPARERPKPPARDYWYCVDLDRLEKVIQLCPDTIFIGHAPGFWRHISGDGYSAEQNNPCTAVTPGGRVPEMLAKHKTLYADLSANSGFNALSRPPEGHGRKFLLEFQDKLLFGRDGFDDKLLDFLKMQNLPQEVWDKLTWKNALKLVPLRAR